MELIFSQQSAYPATHGLFFGTNQGNPNSKPPSPDGEAFSVPVEEVPGTNEPEDGTVSPPTTEVQ